MSALERIAAHLAARGLIYLCDRCQAEAVRRA